MRPSRPALDPRLTAGLVALALGVATAAGQQRITLTPDSADPNPQRVARPGAASRVVKSFDFEEQATNPGEVPEHWFRGQDAPDRPRAGFPAWNRSELVYAAGPGVASSGVGAVRLPTAGGSTSLVLGEGAVPVFAGTDYRITARVKTDALTHARAVLAARLLDAGSRVIPGSESRSGPLASERAWMEAAVEVRGDFNKAAYLQIELLLLQPEQQQGAAAAGPRAIWAQDYQGAAWFDDVVVAQLPRIEIGCTAPGNMVTAPARPELRLVVRDLTGEPLTAHLEVADVFGARVDALDMPLGAGATSTPWTPRVTRYGWYRASMRISMASGSRVGESAADFVYMEGQAGPSDPATAADRARFGIVMDTLPAAGAGQLRTLAQQAGAAFITVPVWESGLTFAGLADHTERLGSVVDGLLTDRMGVTLSMPVVPLELAAAQQVEADDPWTLLAGNESRWMAWAQPMLERFGHRINRWQVGGAGAEHLPDPRTAAASAAAITKALSKAVSGPALVLARDLSATSDGGLSVAGVPSEAEAVRVSETAHAWASTGHGEVTLVLQPMEKASPKTAAIETAKRLVEFWAGAAREHEQLAGEMRIALEQPWRWEARGQRGAFSPSAALAAWPSVAHRLAGRRVIGPYAAGEGCTAFILGPAAGGVATRDGLLVAWKTDHGDGEAVLAADLSDGPVRLVDMFGNVEPAPSLTRTRSGLRPLTRLALTEAPLFIEGVDLELLQLVSGITIEPPTLTPSIEQHDHAIVIHNPYATSISGQVTILEPGGFEAGTKDRAWRIAPRAQRFTIAPGKTQSLPFQLAFTAAEEIGPRPFVLGMDLNAGREYGTVEVRRTLNVQVKGLTVELTATAKGKDGQDVSIEASVLNQGERPVTLEATAFAEGFARFKASIIDLAPQKKAVRTFVYPGALEKLRGKRVLLSIFDPETKSRVNKSVVVP